MDQPTRSPFDLVVIAVSLGGPASLQEILGALPGDFAVPIVVVQHMAPTASALVTLLRRKTRVQVRWAEHENALMQGTVLIAPPDRHVVVQKNRLISLNHRHKVNWARPSADVLFESAAAVFQRRLLAVVLSGCGRDGAYGARAVKNFGGWVIAQDPLTSIGFQMPMAAIDTGAVDFVMPLSSIASALTTLVGLPNAIQLFQTGPAFCLSHAKHCRKQITARSAATFSIPNGS